MDSKKDCSFLTNAVAHTALGWFRLKNSVSKKTRNESKEGEKYSERISEDPYAPFVKPNFYEHCQFENKNERPVEKLMRAKCVADLFRDAVAMYGDRECLGYRPILDVINQNQGNNKVFKKFRLSMYRFYSYKDVESLVDNYGKGLRSLGIKPRQNVVLLADTCMDWMCIAQALFRQNMPIVTLYSTLTDEGILHGIRETEAKVVITSREILNRLHKSFSELPQIAHVIYIEAMDGPRPSSIEGKTLLSLFELRRMGEKCEEVFEEATPAHDDPAILMYTSGSTGVPKAVILTQTNVLAASRAISEIYESLKLRPDDSYVAYLPLAHVFELSCELLALLYGVRIGYSSTTTLTDSSTGLAPGIEGDCTLLKPTIFCAVPLVLDRVRKSVLEKAASKGATAQRVLELAIESAIRRYKAGQDATVYDKDVFQKIRSVIGGRVRIVATGSAPFSPETHDFIRAALGCNVIQGYGLTESCAAATCMDIMDNSTGTVGGPVQGAYVRLLDWQEGNYLVKENRGEIILGGDMIAAGYYKNPALTEESFFEEGGVRWFRTGDIGERLSTGAFKIIDRKKDLVKLQHGEYVSLGKIETELKTNQFVDQICVCGNGLQTFLVAVVQVSQKNLMSLASEASVEPTLPPPALCKEPAVVELLLTILQGQLQRRGFLRVEIPKRLTICHEEWTPESGLVTAAMKLRRKQVEERFSAEIAEMYAQN